MSAPVSPDRPAGLPPELLAPAPRPLPAWARRPRFVANALALAASVGLLLAPAVAWPRAPREPILAVLALLVVLELVLALATLQTRTLLSTGQAVSARILHAWYGRALVLDVELERDGARQRRTVRALPDVVLAAGFWPRPGDVAFLALDPRARSRCAVWGIAPAEGRPPRREMPWTFRFAAEPLRGVGVTRAMLLAIVLSAAVAAIVAAAVGGAFR